MPFLSKSAREVRTDATGWRIWIEVLGMATFEFFKLLHEHVELPVADLGVVQHIIIVVMSVQ